MTIMLTLLAALVLGACLVWLTPPDGEEPLLVADVFAITVLAALSAFVAQRTGRVTPNAPARGALAFLSRRQWMILLLGLTAVAVLTGTGTGFRILNVATPAAAPPPPAPEVTSAAPVPSPLPTPPSPSPSDRPSASPSDSASTSDGSPDPGGVTPAPGATTYLDSTRPVNASSYDSGAVNLSGKRYPRSVTLYCSGSDGGYVEWSVAGSRSFSATAGIADDARDTTGAIAEWLFYDQDGHQLGKTIDVSVGHPAAVTLNLQNVVRLRVLCQGRDGKSSGGRFFYAVLGDAVLVSA